MAPSGELSVRQRAHLLRVLAGQASQQLAAPDTSLHLAGAAVHLGLGPANWERQRARAGLVQALRACGGVAGSGGERSVGRGTCSGLGGGSAPACATDDDDAAMLLLAVGPMMCSRSEFKPMCGAGLARGGRDWGRLGAPGRRDTSGRSFTSTGVAHPPKKITPRGKQPSHRAGGGAARQQSRCRLRDGEVGGRGAPAAAHLALVIAAPDAGAHAALGPLPKLLRRDAAAQARGRELRQAPVGGRPLRGAGVGGRQGVWCRRWWRGWLSRVR